MSVHDIVRQEMFSILCEGDYRIHHEGKKVDFANKEARALFLEGVHFFNEAHLRENVIVQDGNNTVIITWLGDKTVNTVAALLSMYGFEVSNFAGVIEVVKASATNVAETLRTLAKSELPDATELAHSVPEKRVDKFDEFLPDELLAIGYGARAFNVRGAKSWLINNFP